MNLEFKPDQGPLKVFQSIPQSLQRLHIPGTIPIYLQTAFASFLFQQFKGEGFTGWFNRGNAFGNGYIGSEGPDAALEYRCFLTGQLEGDWDGISRPCLLPGTFNFTGTPEVKTKARFRPGREYSWFDLQCERTFVQKFAEIHPEFKAFLEIFDSGQPIQLGKQDYPCSERMLEAINSIIYSYYDPVLRAMTLEGYVMIILAEAFHVAFYNNIPPPQKIMLQSHQYEQVTKAHDYILTEGFNNPLTNAHLCEKFMLPKAVLLQGFRELYNCSPQKLARKSRYDQIKGLLLQGYTPTEVARKANFENDTYFYNAFQKYCGCTPAEFQNRNIKKILFHSLKSPFS